MCERGAQHGNDTNIVPSFLDWLWKSFVWVNCLRSFFWSDLNVTPWNIFCWVNHNWRFIEIRTWTNLVVKRLPTRGKWNCKSRCNIFICSLLSALSGRFYSQSGKKFLPREVSCVSKFDIFFGIVPRDFFRGFLDNNRSLVLSRVVSNKLFKVNICIHNTATLFVHQLKQSIRHECRFGLCVIFRLHDKL